MMKRINFEKCGYNISATDTEDTVGIILIKIFFEAGEIFSSVRQKENLVNDDQLVKDYCKLKDIYPHIDYIVNYSPMFGVKFNAGMTDAMYTIYCKFYILLYDYELFSPELIEKYKIIHVQQEEQRKQKEEEDARKEEERKKVEEELDKENERIRKEINDIAEEEDRLTKVDRARRIMRTYRKEQKSGKNLHILYDDDEWYDAVEEAEETLSEERRITAKRKREAKKIEENKEEDKEK